MAVADVYAADRNLDATYLIRMFSVFERAIFSYWRLLPGNDARDVEGDVRLDEVGAACVILQDVIDEPQAVRVHRNSLVPRRIDDYYAMMTFANARAVCSRIAYSDQKRPWCSYLLPAGEGAPQGRMRAELLALARNSPHPAVPATFSPREKERRPRRACNSTVKRANQLLAMTLRLIQRYWS